METETDNNLRLQYELLDLKEEFTALNNENATLKTQLHNSRELADSLQERLLMLTDDDVPESLRHRSHPTGAQQVPLTVTQFKSGDVVIGNGSNMTRAVVVTCGASNQPLVVQTPPMMCPFGIYDANGKSRMNVRFAFRSERNGRLFRKQLAELEDRIRKQFTESDAALRFVPCLGVKDGTLRASVSLGDCRAFDGKQQSIDVRKCLSAGSIVLAILRCHGIWFTEDKRFGLSWTVLQVKQLSGATSGLGQYAFQDD